MSQKTPQTKYLKDYQEPNYWVNSIDLKFELFEDETIVTSTVDYIQNKSLLQSTLSLDGQDQELISIKLNQTLLSKHDYTLDEESLTLKSLPENVSLEIVSKIHPEKNTALEGLYQSNDMFCTQCEAEGFRKITYFQDRPDIMASYSTTIIADQTKYPILLSNGNLKQKGTLENNRHWVRWEDPFKKPCYLFALVAGNLTCIEDSFITMNQKTVSLQIYVEHENKDKCDHAMKSLKQAMKWDEENYGREYDLDIYMIVAVNDFNMGAMENKGLNIFNSQYVLAKPETATDQDYENIQGVIAHEYFHNWTGNRVTLKNWFQLSLKEGLTVFRDQQFTADMTDATVKRIDDVRRLRKYQFREDASPMAHSVRPEFYIEMNNFYTTTVYEKGAEVIRMIHQLLGKKVFRKGMDLYFKKYDGHAVTCEDFVKTMEEVSRIDLSQFRLWYEQAGTPEIEIHTEYDSIKKIFSLILKQYCPDTPKQTKKKPMLIPISIGLLKQNGKPITLSSSSLIFSKKTETFIFENIPEKPILSFLQNFSAPVKIKHEISNEELAFLLAKDTDLFNRWNAGQQLFISIMKELIEKKQENKELLLDSFFIDSIRSLLFNSNLSKSFIAETLQFPTPTELIDILGHIHMDEICSIHEFIIATLADKLFEEMKEVYQTNHVINDLSITKNAIAQRSLKNCILNYLSNSSQQKEIIPILMQQFETANNMTDQIAVLSALTHLNIPERKQALDSFYTQWKHEPLVMNKWLAVQAYSKLENTLQSIEALLQHSVFSIKNPNNVRSLIGVFARENIKNFHKIDGLGYCFLSDQILKLDNINPQIAARLATVFHQWASLDEIRKNLMLQELKKIIQHKNLSKDVYEIISKAIEQS